MPETNPFITLLKSEHTAILKIFLEIDKIKSLEAIKAKVHELVSITVNHLKKEDEILYPALSGSKNEEIKKIGDLFSGTIKPYTKQFILVTQEIQSSQVLNDQLLEKYHDLRDKIKSRITIEENVLYSAYCTIKTV